MPAEPEGDDMGGDVFVCGDITTTQQAAEAPATQPAATQKMWPYVLAAALGAGGLGIGATALINSLLAKPETPVVSPDTNTDTQYELRISSGDQPTK